MTTKEIIKELNVPEHELVDCINDMVKRYHTIEANHVFDQQEGDTERELISFIRSIDILVLTYPVSIFIQTSRQTALLNVLLVRCLHNSATGGLDDVYNYFYGNKDYIFITNDLDLFPTIYQLN